MKISETPTINPTTNSGLCNYLRGVSNDELFAQEVLIVLSKNAALVIVNVITIISPQTKNSKLATS